MTLRYFQKGFNYSQDGPGNRLVIHLQGCNLHCPWCANPEGMSTHPALLQKTDKLPSYVCPHGAVAPDGRLDRSHCAACPDRACQTVNRSTLLTCSAHDVPVETLYDEILACRAMLIGGGVTFSGGEATLQFAPLRQLLFLLHDAGIHTAIETNATNPRLSELFGALDYLIADYKHHDAARLRAAAGADLAVIEQNLHAAAAAQLPMLVRVLLIHGLNDTRADAAAFLRALSPLQQLNPNFHLEFLTYHEYGKVKWQQCGLNYTMQNAFVAPETVQYFTEAFRAAGIHVIKT